jgi:hypothetical protein
VDQRPPEWGCSVSDKAVSMQNQQDKDQPRRDGDKGGELSGELIPEEVVAHESAMTAEQESAPAKSAEKAEVRDGVSEAKASRRRSSPSQLMELEIGAIHGEHPQVDKVRDEAGVQLRELTTTVLSRISLMELATHLPLHVVHESGKFYCIGGLRFFRLIQYGLPADNVVPVFLYGGLNAKRLRSHILFDLFVVPALASLDRHDRRSLQDIWTKFGKEELFERALEYKSGEALAKLLNCELRKTGKASK